MSHASISKTMTCSVRPRYPIAVRTHRSGPSYSRTLALPQIFDLPPFGGVHKEDKGVRIYGKTADCDELVVADEIDEGKPVALNDGQDAGWTALFWI